jgi:hypothetical protein
VNANQKTAMMKAISDGLRADDGEPEPGPEEWSAPAARLADLVSPEAVDRMLADADEAGVSAEELLAGLTKTVPVRAGGRAR